MTETSEREGDGALDATAPAGERGRVETAALLGAARAVLTHRRFEEAARAIFDAAKELLGATAGYVALLSAEGSENEVVFLDAGGRPCTVDESLPMPIRGLRARAYKTGQVVYENAFAASEWMQWMPAGHAALDNVLFAPLVLGGRVEGLMGLANKPGGFTKDDARLAGGFAEFVAIALRNSRWLSKIERSEQRFRALTDTATDAIVCADVSGRIVTWNRAAQKVFGYAEEEAMGRPVTMLMPKRFRGAHVGAFGRVVTGRPASLLGRTIELWGERADGTEFPLELSLAGWQYEDDVFFTAIIRDISERRRHEEELLAGKALLEERVRRRTADLASTVASLESEVRSRLRAEREREELERQVIEAGELRQQSVGRDLHDSLGQTLTGLAFLAKGLARTLRQSSPEESRVAEQIAGMVNESISRVRLLARGLNPAGLSEDGLAGGLCELADGVSAVFPIRCTAECELAAPVGDDVVAAHLYRIAQEAVSNATRHSGASTIRIALTSDAAGVRLAVEDDGRGIAEGAARSPGMGMRIMKYRAGMIAGTLTVARREEGGTIVSCVLGPRKTENGIAP